jgi:hypothetical protein
MWMFGEKKSVVWSFRLSGKNDRKFRIVPSRDERLTEVSFGCLQICTVF